jgi:hypothetical protein
MNILDLKKRVDRVFESCQTPGQLETARKFAEKAIVKLEDHFSNTLPFDIAYCKLQYYILSFEEKYYDLKERVYAHLD